MTPTTKMKSKVLLSVLFVFAFFVSAVGCTANNHQAKFDEYASFIPVIKLNIGQGDAEVAYSGNPNDGPAAFAVDGNDLYILDTLNTRIIVFTNTVWDRNIALPFCIYPIDITVHKSNIYILDSAGVVHQIDTTGVLVDSYQLPINLDISYIKKIDINNDDDLVITDINERMYILNNGEYVIENSITSRLSDSQKSIGIYVDDVLFTNIKLAEINGSVNVITQNNDGSMFVEVIDNVPNSALVLCESTLRLIDNNGEQVAVARIPLEEYSNVPHRLYEISETGEIYIMEMRSDSLQIKKIKLGLKYISVMDELKAKALAYNNANQ